MLRYLTVLCFSLFLFVACDQADRPIDPADNDVATPAVDLTDDSSPALDEVDRLYTLNVVDATVKSPRKELVGKAGAVDVTINYGSPAVNERTIYGDLVPYGKVWRTGANEATRITFSQNVLVGPQEQPLEAGTYSLFTLPASKDDWTFIFNKKADQWGAYDYEDTDDVLRVEGQAMPLSKPAERMDFATDNGIVKLMWSDLAVGFTVKPAAK